MGENNNNKGYMIFNAEGSVPTATLAAIGDDAHTQVIINGSRNDMVKMFGQIAQALNGKDVNMPVGLLTSIVEAACRSGEAWGFILDLMDKHAEKVAKKVESGEMDIEEASEDFFGMFSGGDNDD